MVLGIFTLHKFYDYVYFMNHLCYSLYSIINEWNLRVTILRLCHQNSLQIFLVSKNVVSRLIPCAVYLIKHIGLTSSRVMQSSLR